MQSDLMIEWGEHRCVPSFDKTSDERLSRICFYCSLFLLQLDRLQLTAVYRATDGEV